MTKDDLVDMILWRIGTEITEAISVAKDAQEVADVLHLYELTACAISAALHGDTKTIDRRLDEISAINYEEAINWAQVLPGLLPKPSAFSKSKWISKAIKSKTGGGA